MGPATTIATFPNAVQVGDEGASAASAVWALRRTMASEPTRSANTDRALLERMEAGEDRALGELFARHGSALYALACAIVGEPADAEEVVADAFGQAWRTAGRFDPARGSVIAWLSTITRTRALDLVRARGRRIRAVERAARRAGDGLATPVRPLEPADRQVERTEARRLVTGALDDLPEPQRRVIELAYFGGLSQSEIAAELGEPLGTVKTRMRAALEKLRSALAPLVAEPER